MKKEPKFIQVETHETAFNSIMPNSSEENFNFEIRTNRSAIWLAALWERNGKI